MHFYHRLQCLPPQLHILIQARLASTTASSYSKSAYPFPNNPKPTPHQIFHLKHGASPEEIKARYYDLVRIHHPDSPSCRHLPPADRHSRFQAITAAYDSLRKGSTVSSHFDVYAEEVARRKRAYQRQNARRAQYAAPNRYQWNTNADDRWKDHLLIAIGVMTLLVGVAPGIFLYPFQMQQRHRDAVISLAQAHAEAKELGDDRRREMRNRVKESTHASARDARLDDGDQKLAIDESQDEDN